MMETDIPNKNLNLFHQYLFVIDHNNNKIRSLSNRTSINTNKLQ